ncbi:hypothetical protein JMJ56_18610 [Belnapia sp. T18]|uniref:Uncharacterized protein n=1 Tax=Belnapia arida TaxID=2804533 RepID=A0ABS1U5U5_9PROT|nr:hypothetical protein [Belnapia arida]MBL6080037.1 hypothetical protein [Belnapia arida]
MSLLAAAPEWLDSPWADAMLMLLADGAAGADAASLPSWPGTAIEAEAALADPALRGALGRWLAPVADGDADAIAAVMRDRPGARLALAPPAALLDVVAMGTAWLSAPSLATLLRRAEMAAARAALGERAWSLAFGRCALLPRPSAALVEALDAAPASDDMLAPGARLLGLALGDMPAPVLARFGLRAPKPVWEAIIGACRESDQGPAALAALRRLFREEAPAWFGWSR